MRPISGMPNATQALSVICLAGRERVLPVPRRKEKRPLGEQVYVSY